VERPSRRSVMRPLATAGQLGTGCRPCWAAARWPGCAGRPYTWTARRRAVARRAGQQDHGSSPAMNRQEGGTAHRHVRGARADRWREPRTWPWGVRLAFAFAEGAGTTGSRRRDRRLTTSRRMARSLRGIQGSHDDRRGSVGDPGQDGPGTESCVLALIGIAESRVVFAPKFRTPSPEVCCGAGAAERRPSGRHERGRDDPPGPPARSQRHPLIAVLREFSPGRHHRRHRKHVTFCAPLGSLVAPPSSAWAILVAGHGPARTGRPGTGIRGSINGRGQREPGRGVE